MNINYIMYPSPSSSQFLSTSLLIRHRIITSLLHWLISGRSNPQAGLEILTFFSPLTISFSLETQSSSQYSRTPSLTGSPIDIIPYACGPTAVPPTMHYQFTAYLFLTFALFGTVFSALDDTKIVRHVYQTVSRPGRTGGDEKFDIVGYRGKLLGADPSNPATLDMAGLQALAIEAHRIMNKHAEKEKKTNEKLKPGDPNKKGAALVPIMMTAMRPGPPGTAIYFHSSLKGPGQGESFLLDIAPGEAHRALTDLIVACKEAAGSNHANEANCGEVMALNEFAKEELATASTINLFEVKGKLLISVIKIKGQYIVMSPCTSSKDPRTGQEKKENDPRYFGCSKVSIMAGFQRCEIGWTPNATGGGTEMPTDDQLQELLKGKNVYQGTGTPLQSRPGTPQQSRPGTPTKAQRRGLGNAVENRGEIPKKAVPRAPVPPVVPKKTVPKKTPVKPVAPKKPVTTTPKTNPPTTPRKPAKSGKGPVCQLKPVNFGGIRKGGGTVRPGKTTTPKKKTAGPRRWIL